VLTDSDAPSTYWGMMKQRLANPMCEFSGGNHLSEVQRWVAQVNVE
jgi:hypothetical protein